MTTEELAKQLLDWFLENREREHFAAYVNGDNLKRIVLDGEFNFLRLAEFIQKTITEARLEAKIEEVNSWHSIPCELRVERIEELRRATNG